MNLKKKARAVKLVFGIGQASEPAKNFKVAVFYAIPAKSPILISGVHLMLVEYRYKKVLKRFSV